MYIYMNIHIHSVVHTYYTRSCAIIRVFLVYMCIHAYNYAHTCTSSLIYTQIMRDSFLCLHMHLCACMYIYLSTYTYVCRCL